MNELKKYDFKKEEWSIYQNILYFYLPDGRSKSIWNNTFAEKKLKVIATGRNRNTITIVLNLSKNTKI